MRRRWFWPAWLLTLLVIGCAEPPTREMDQAQGAIDAAKAAGAEKYAADEYTAAVDALSRSQDAVDHLILSDQRYFSLLEAGRLGMHG